VLVSITKFLKKNKCIPLNLFYGTIERLDYANSLDNLFRNCLESATAHVIPLSFAAHYWELNGFWIGWGPIL